ncbi:Grx4 family monothiol glutaredoxin [Leptospira biflexa]|jgi:monothiol glutaredoxin|uniref:Glutaredoxin n=1 Tax=Leptospira biflexa serovar Patoc (strain Patoc 1 / ATCC 23582 / Paris) TaxID=456481 RepID=B0SSC3_LEPBP|nr:Grx4 family monothiol glutaredoxin [Leptospira biflexa]ABZ94361.1 Glutaredoxin-related protein [Leptospira biflexa serovar Patoc strain 'Patoc 1 (Ames)']ABZ98013.1 Putative glutaredoxin-related protein [Leptospira biflexa serovar Patoc strain 'Patoc 1 (Paris)']TGM36714.1 Grx4 family monothiol glutaredoxin [Leptospira biflexa]TGM39698.1 Grx4 family monothiol glutaredoxin [Leptospira biflexa]TGM45145.1 Grx4 family monothiol glutaredoxin [Leptospira biflexa]
MEQELKDKIESLIKSEKVFLFMKGTPEMPQCGFSAGVVSTLKQQGISFGSFNVLSDMNIREGIKEYTNWPTIPQLYINGEFVGGHDITVQMAQSGELKKKIG